MHRTTTEENNQDLSPAESCQPAASGQRLVVWVSLILGVFGAMGILLRSPYWAHWKDRNAASAADVQRRREMRSGRQELSESGFNGSVQNLPEVVPLREPLFVANLTDYVQNYVVSVRRVNGLGFPFEANVSKATVVDETRPIILSLQVMANSADAMERVVSITDELTVIDSLGNRIRPIATRPFEFPDGVGCVFFLPPSSASVTSLKRVCGKIKLRASGRGDGKDTREQPGKALDFCIRNVPVPWYPHVFGMVGALAVEEGTALAQLVHTVSATNYQCTGITNDEFEPILKAMGEAAFQSPDLKLPDRIVLTQNAANTLRLPVRLQNAPRLESTAFETLTLTPHLTTDGEIVVRVRLGKNDGPAIEQKLSVWDNEPVLCLFPTTLRPGQKQQKRHLLVYLHLFLDRYTPNKIHNGAFPRRLKAQNEDRGGALSGQVTTSVGGFGIGSAILQMGRLNSAGVIEGKIEKIRVGLNREGRFSLANLSAGRYRVRLVEVVPYISRAAIHSSFTQFLTHRTGLADPVLKESLRECTVKAGEQVALTPWTYEEAVTSAIRRD